MQRLKQALSIKNIMAQTFIVLSIRLLESIESLNEALPAEVGGEPVVVAQQSFAVSVQEVEADSFEGQTISANVMAGGINLGFNNSEIVETKPAASVQLPSNLFRASKGNSSRITNSIFLTDALFLRRNPGFDSVGSIIMSAGIAGVKRVYNLTNPRVRMEFQKNKVSY